MKKAPVGIDDARRVDALRGYDVLDSASDEAFDGVVALIGEVCRVPIALISLLDDDRMWVKACHGSWDFSVTRAISFCGHAIVEPDDVFVVNDASADVRFYDNPLVVGDPFIRFYAAAPLVTAEGFALGTLCILDTEPRTLAERDRAVLRLGARCVIALLEDRRSHGQLERAQVDRRKLARDNDDLAGEIERRAAVEARLAYAARHDQLTSLPNRGYFVERLRSRLATEPASRTRPPFAVMFVDIDRFKDVNDTFGHLLGDELLIAIARRLSHFVRGNDIVARLGGDEFTVLIDVVQDLESLAHLAERLGGAIAVPFRLGGADIGVSASVGIVIATDAYVRAEDVLRDADTAMFAAKAAGRNRFEFFRDDARKMRIP